MKTSRPSMARYLTLASYVLFWTVTFNLCCLFSRECRAIRRDCKAKGENIDQVESCIDELIEQHRMLFYI